MLGQTGLRDWLIQRFTAIFLGFYTLFLLWFMFSHPGFAYEEWLSLFTTPIMQLSTLIALVCISLHAWIGMQIILTDYVRILPIRFLFQAFFALVLFTYIVWGIFILWGN